VVGTSLSNPPERIGCRAAQCEFVAPRVVDVRVRHICAVIRQRPRRAERIVVVVARQPDRRAFAVLAEQIAVELRLVGVHGPKCILIVGFGEVVLEIPNVLCRAGRVFLRRP
jgi:hypothetical protein